VDSCLALGPPAIARAEALCAWLAETDRRFSEDWWWTSSSSSSTIGRW
jgi:hypothetical protein